MVKGKVLQKGRIVYIEVFDRVNLNKLNLAVAHIEKLGYSVLTRFRRYS